VATLDVLLFEHAKATEMSSAAKRDAGKGCGYVGQKPGST
jgi:hypothetical protein